MTPPQVEGEKKTIILYPVQTWTVCETTHWMMKIKHNTEK